MIRVFFDSSVLFAAAYSSRGHSRDLLLMAGRRDIVAVASPVVLEETRRNIAESAPECLPVLERLLEQVAFELVRPSKREVLAAARQIALKDAPILAAARRARVHILVTLDRKHLLDKPALARYARTKILTPKDTVAALTGEND